MTKAKVLREVVLPWVGVSILELEDGVFSVEVAGEPGHNHDDFDWSEITKLLGGRQNHLVK